MKTKSYIKNTGLFIANNTWYKKHICFKAIYVFILHFYTQTNSLQGSNVTFELNWLNFPNHVE